MVHAVERAGPHDPLTATPPRAPGSSRRTSTIDCTRPGGLDGPMQVEGRARDLITATDGETVVRATDGVRIELVFPGHEIAAVTSERVVDGLQGLCGTTIGAGFRGHVARVVPAEVAARSPLALLLDDLPGALLVSGYALQHAGRMDGGELRESAREHIKGAADICAGWDRTGTIFVVLDQSGDIPTPLGPPAPSLDRPEDPLAWHEVAALLPHATRRRRRLDVSPGDDGTTWEIDQHFRDTHADGDGNETVVHEYEVHATYDAVAATLRSCTATARVLPWMECPGALASAGRVVGRPVADLRADVRRDFTGVTTCTHLNDMLRGLADIETLVRR